MADLTQQVRGKVPTRARALLDAAIDHGWAVAWQPGFDTSGAPFITVRAAHFNPDAPDTEIRVTWHTRDTGTYRLFSAIAREPGHRGWHDITLTRAEAIIRRADELEQIDLPEQPDEKVECPECSGTGKTYLYTEGPDGPDVIEHDCAECEGTGTVWRENANPR